MRWLIVALAVISAGWLTFDGLHALVTGDYVTPSSGQHAGQLGPWSKLFEAIGVEPRSFAVKCLHVAVGGVWLVVIGAFAFRVPNAWYLMLAGAIATAWYLPFGTLISLVVIGLLFLPGVRSG